MCLACYANIKSPENLEIAKTHAKPAPWQIDIISGKEFGEMCAPDPARIVEWRGILEIRHVSLNNPVTNQSVELTEDQIEEIAENALAVIVTGVDQSLTIWALQWPNDYEIKNTLEKSY